MKRNLLPLFKADAIIGKANRGEWTHLQQPDHLGRVEFGKQNTEQAFHARVQSIPSPWARILLFRNALEEPGHPARALVASEILDALEFVWGLQSQSNLELKTEVITLEDLQAEAMRGDSDRMIDFAKALMAMRPVYRHGGGTKTIATVTLGLVNGHPVLMSSPYTLFATAEDAGQWVPGQFFRFGATGKFRALRDRPREFQAYVAQIVRPQIMAGAEQQPDVEAEWGLVVRLLGDWLRDELTKCAGVPNNLVDAKWSDAAGRLKLRQSQRVGAFTFFQTSGVPESRWQLLSRFGGNPLVIVPSSFDGFYFKNAPRVTLPKELPSKRTVLPGTTTTREWVAPEQDWFTSKLLLLNEPLDLTRVRWLEADRYNVQNTDDRRFAQPRFLLPLTAKFFQYFSVEDALRMLSIETRANGVTVKLSLKVGPESAAETIEIKREYPEHDIRAQGPEMAIWPSFAHPNWEEYVVFRIDTSPALAKWLRVDGLDAGGVRIASRTDVRRNPQAQAIAFKQPPVVLEVISRETEVEQSLGVLFPTFDEPPALSEQGATVGIDFGTSNTVVGWRATSVENGAIIGFDELTSFLTKPGIDARDLVAAYFFPTSVPAEPFGTAVVHVRDLGALDIEKDRLGIRINVPFSGYIDGSRDEKSEKFNKVVGDLKWSTEASAHHLSLSFLRFVASLVVARALLKGVAPWNLEFKWSYPRAFTETDVAKMTMLWTNALKNIPWNPSSAETSGEAVPQSIKDAAEHIDESRCVLRHFFAQQKVGLQGTESVILDVGGGTTDIAIYGSGAAPILDSIMLGGRNLTGDRVSGGRRGHNPFVGAFVAWAETNGLPARDRDVVRAYMDDGQVHLAFSYLVTTKWFGSGRASVFTDNPAYLHFQACVFYFFGALAHYTGLSVRTEHGAPRVPIAVYLGGNGSRYLDWLTDFARKPEQDRFKRALGTLLLNAAGAPADMKLPEIRLSEHPKREVALGLVAKADPQNDKVPIITSVCGEDVRAGIGERPGGVMTFSPGSRLKTQDVIVENRVSELEWIGDRMEIERYHDALIGVCAGVADHGGAWPLAANRYQRVFESLDARSLQHLTKTRIENLANSHQSYRGSIFVLEASLVLEHMLETFFASPGIPTYSPGKPVAR
jgi:hypothetical protein